MRNRNYVHRRLVTQASLRVGRVSDALAADLYDAAGYATEAVFYQKLAMKYRQFPLADYANPRYAMWMRYSWY